MPIILSRDQKSFCLYHRLEKIVFDVVRSITVMILFSHGSENIPVEKSSAPRFETWNGSRDPSGTNLAWVDLFRIIILRRVEHNFKVLRRQVVE